MSGLPAAAARWPRIRPAAGVAADSGSHGGAPHQTPPDAALASDAARARRVAGAIHPVGLIFQIGCGQERQVLPAARPEFTGLTKQALSYCLRCHVPPVTPACIYPRLYVCCQHNHLSVTYARRIGPCPWCALRCAIAASGLDEVARVGAARRSRSRRAGRMDQAITADGVWASRFRALAPGSFASGCVAVRFQMGSESFWTGNLDVRR